MPDLDDLMRTPEDTLGKPGKNEDETRLSVDVDSVTFPLPAMRSQETPDQDERPDTIRPRRKSPQERLIGRATVLEYAYGILGLVLGLAAIIGGVVLGVHGVAGSTSWTTRMLGLNMQVNDAAPGVVLFFVGLMIVWATKPKVRFRNLH